MCTITDNITESIICSVKVNLLPKVPLIYVRLGVIQTIVSLVLKFPVKSLAHERYDARTPDPAPPYSIDQNQALLFENPSSP